MSGHSHVLLKSGPSLPFGDATARDNVTHWRYACLHSMDIDVTGPYAAVLMTETTFAEFHEMLWLQIGGARTVHHYWASRLPLHRDVMQYAKRYTALLSP